MKRGLLLGLMITPIVLLAQINLKGKAFELSNDTLKSNLRLCDSLAEVEYQKLININIYLDNRFIVIDSLKAQIDNDTIYDYIYVLSNKLQQQYLPNSSCEAEYNKRLLICFFSDDKHCPLTINENVILNQQEYQVNPFRKISLVDKGFKLSFYLGTRVKYFYDFYFKMNKNNDWFLYRTESSSYDIHVSNSNKSQKKYYSYSERTSLKNIDIRDFINYYQ